MRVRRASPLAPASGACRASPLRAGALGGGEGTPADTHPAGASVIGPLEAEPPIAALGRGWRVVVGVVVVVAAHAVTCSRSVTTQPPPSGCSSIVHSMSSSSCASESRRACAIVRLTRTWSRTFSSVHERTSDFTRLTEVDLAANRIHRPHRHWRSGSRRRQGVLRRPHVHPRAPRMVRRRPRRTTQLWA